MSNPSSSVLAVTGRLTDSFKRLVPLRMELPKGGRPTAGDLQRSSANALAEFYAVARIERQNNSLGIVGRARVAFSLQQRLVAEGYPPPLVKQVLFAMLISAFTGSTD